VRRYARLGRLLLTLLTDAAQDSRTTERAGNEVRRRINPLKGSDGRWLHFEVFSAIQV